MPQKLNTATNYEKDISFWVNGKAIKGVGSVPLSLSYEIEIKYTFGKINVLTLETCHRNITLENQGNKTSYTFTPSDIEKKDSCPLDIGIYDLKGRDGWGFLQFEREEATLVAGIQCNGDYWKAKGVSICQSKVGTLQKIGFDVPVKAANDDGCKLTQAGNEFTYEVKNGYCFLEFEDAQGNFHEHTIFGYQTFIIRN